MSKRTLLITVCAVAMLVLTTSSAFAYVPLGHWERYGHADRTYSFNVNLHAGRHYVAEVVATDRHYIGSVLAPDMDLYLTNPAGQTFAFTRYGNEHVDFVARFSGTYHFRVKCLYGNGPFFFQLGQDDVIMYDAPAH